MGQRFVVNKGGTASGKSFSSAQKELLLSCCDGQRTLIIRKIASTLKDSVIPSFRARIAELGMEEYMRENKSERSFIHALTGASFIFRGLDDPEKLKSIEGIDRILIEEATELTIEDFYELNRRARGREKIQITLNFNPIDERHWLKKHFYEQEVTNAAKLESTFEHNPFLTEHDRTEISYLKQFNYNQYRIYALGEWGVAQVDNPWLYSFELKKHVSPLPLDLLPNNPVHLSFDFNINPMCCIAFQYSRHRGEGTYVRVIKEFELKNTTAVQAGKLIKAHFPHHVLTVTGDATGRNKNAGYSQADETIWTQMIRTLGISAAQMLNPTRNASHKESRYLCNYLLQEHPSFLIDPGCESLINDCLTARPIETDDPNKEDQLLKGPGNSTLGFNLLDCLRYAIWTHLKDFGRRIPIGTPNPPPER